MADLLEQAKQDALDILTNKSDFAVDITLTAPDTTVLVIQGFAVKHHIGIDGDGNVRSTTQAHIFFPEKPLTDEAYPVRDANGQVHLDKHIAEWKDSTGLLGKYVIEEWYPDEMLGLILCILGRRK